MVTRKRAGAPFDMTPGSKLDVVTLGKWLHGIREAVGTPRFALAEKIEAPYQNLSRFTRLRIGANSATAPSQEQRGRGA